MKSTGFVIFLFTLLFSPIAFGAEEEWARTIMEAACFLGLLGHCISSGLRRQPLLKVPGLAFYSLFLAFVLLQLLPLPAGVVKLISPASYNLYQESIGILAMPGWLPLTNNVRETLGELLRYSAYGAFYILAIQLMADAERLRRTLFVVVGWGFAIALFAILQKYLGNGRMFWFRPLPGCSFFGPYANYNHFAGYMEMLTPVALGLFLYYRPRVRYAKGFRQSVAEIFNYPGSNVHMLLGFAVLLMAASIILSRSRGGTISFGLAGLLLTFLLYQRDKKPSFTFFVTAFSGLFILAFSWFGWNEILQRFAQIPEQQGDLFANGRMRFWQDTLLIIRDFPFTGSGLGTFSNIFPSYRHFTGDFFVNHAHQDYLETMSDLGLLGSGIIVCFLAACFHKIWKVVRTRRDRFAIHLCFGSLAGVFALLVHSLSDFNFQIPANGLYFFFIMALAVSAGHSRFHGERVSLLQRKTGAVLPVVLAGLCFFLFLAAITFNVGVILAKGQYPSEAFDDDTEQEVLLKIERVEQAMRYDPLSAKYQYLLANNKAYLGDTEAAADHYRKSIRLNPVRAKYLHGFGSFLAAQGQLQTAELLFQTGIQRDKSNPHRYRTYAEFLLAHEKREKVLQVMGQALALDTPRNKEELRFLVDAGFADKDIRRALPDRARPYLDFAAMLEKQGKLDMAATLYRQGLNFINNEQAAIRPDYFHRVSRFFSRQQRYEEALAVILQGIETLPHQAGLRVAAGNLYCQLDLTRRAAEEYRQALAIDGGNREAEQHLARLQLQDGRKI